MHNSHVFPQATRMLLIGSLLLTGELTVNARGGEYQYLNLPLQE